jgi:ABC-type transport system involved in Fe-S cluster assembly fused permease/ATPase subunit
LLSLLDTQSPPNFAHAFTLVLGLVFELLLTLGTLAEFQNNKGTSFTGRGADLVRLDKWQVIELSVNLTRIVIFIVMIGLYLASSLSGKKKDDSGPYLASERTSLLDGTPNGGSSANSVNGNARSNGYGTANGGAPGQSTPVQEGQSDGADNKKEAGWERPTKVKPRTWWQYLKGYSRLFPYLWPADSRKLQSVMVLCILLVVVQRVLNVLIPIQSGAITNSLSGEDGQGPRMPWGEIAVYIVYRFLAGGSGLVGSIRSALWIPISQYSYYKLSTKSFEHVHDLDLEFHLGKKTGEVISALNKGSSINTFLEQVTFQVIPMIVDLAVAVFYFLGAFGPYYALVTAIVAVGYLYVTVKLAQWRSVIRREMVNADRAESAVKTDSIMSYETVKYFNAEDWEYKRYHEAVAKYQAAEYTLMYAITTMNVAQNLVFTMGLLITCYLAAYQVTIGEKKVGDFILILTYMMQLQAPLNFFGTFYRMIQNAMINSERMLELLAERPSIVDTPNAHQMNDIDGEVVFDDVHFAYDGKKEALKGLSFTAPPGKTIALVGESGGGKSTVFKLLYRFYDIVSGSITVDGHDIRDVTVDSLRRNIGVVPQHAVLFNESVLYNLQYANQEATFDEIVSACKAASIHDRIETFPDGYNTLVGDRGMRLSGGEMQRVAIARTILKNPKIILLDEATASLDSETEQHIQGALQELSKGRTVVVIA